MNILVIYEGNWADEMDLYGFKIFTEKDKYTKKQIKEAILRCNKKEFNCGSNEEATLSADEFTIKVISDDEYKIIKKLFNLYENSFGMFPDIFEIAKEE